MSTADRPWLAQYAPGVPAEIDVTDESLADLLDDLRGALRRSCRARLLRRDDDVPPSSATRSRGWPNVLLGLGVRRGDRVALVMPNCPQHVVAFYAVLRLGAVVVEHNPLYTREELQHQFDDHGAEVAIAWDKVALALQQVAETAPLRTIVAVDLTTALPAQAAADARACPVAKARATRAAMTAPAPGHAVVGPPAEGRAAARPPTTRGRRPTTSRCCSTPAARRARPRARCSPTATCASNAAQGRAWMPGLQGRPGGRVRRAAAVPRVRPDAVPDVHHLDRRGARAVPAVRRRPGARGVARAGRRRSCPRCRPCTRRSRRRRSTRGVDLSTIRYGISGAMSLPPSTVEQWEAVTGGLLVEGYGMTETSPVTLGNPAGGTRRPGSVGVPFPSTEVRVVDPNDPTHDGGDRRAGRAARARAAGLQRLLEPAGGHGAGRCSRAAGSAPATSW